MSCKEQDPLLRLALHELKIIHPSPTDCLSICRQMYDYVKEDGHDLVKNEFCFCECNTAPRQPPSQSEGTT